MAVNADIYRLRGSTLTQVASDVATPYTDANRQIGDEYFVFPVGEGPLEYTGFVGDQYTISAGWSVRQLHAGQSGDVFTVREGGGDTEQGIGLSDGVVDQSAIESHIGSNDGFVDTWYDAYGNASVVRTTNSEQPYIADAGTLVTAPNGYVGVDFRDRSILRDYSVDPLATQPFLIVAVFKTDSTSADQRLFQGRGSGGNPQLGIGIDTMSIDAGSQVADPFTDTGLVLVETLFDGASSEIIVNGSTLETGDAGSEDLGDIVVGGASNNNDDVAFPLHGYIQELLILDTVPGDRAGLRANINDFYSIY